MAVVSVPRWSARHRASGLVATQRLERAALYVVMVAGALVVLLPFMWMVATSLKTQADIFQYPTDLLPARPTFDAYRDVWVRIPFGQFFLNTLPLAVAFLFGQRYFVRGVVMTGLR